MICKEIKTSLPSKKYISSLYIGIYHIFQSYNLIRIKEGLSILNCYIIIYFVWLIFTHQNLAPNLYEIY